MDKPIKVCRSCGKDSTQVRFRRKRGKCCHCENDYQKQHLAKKKEKSIYYWL